MAIQQYNTTASRVGTLKGDILKHAIPVLVLGISGDQKKMRKNMGDTVIYRRWLPKGGATTNSTTINQWSVSDVSHLTSDGVTPSAETLTPQDISVTIRQYACLYAYTDKTADLYEDKIPDEMKLQCGQRMGLVREMIDYGVLKSGTNKFYSGGTTRATVDEAISLNVIRKATKSLRGNRCREVTSVLSASGNYGTSPVESGFLVFAHTDCEPDIRDLPNFVHVSEYGQRKQVHPKELGSCESFRFILSPELTAIADSGASVGSTGLVSTSASQVDVYPFIVVAADAWANVALRGLDSISPTHKPVGQIDGSDPLGQRGYIGCKFYAAAFIQNDGWMAVIEAGATDV